MKNFSTYSISLGIALVIGTSCNNQEGAKSTPIDATNEAGAAPVQYQGGSPDMTIDTTMQTVPTDKRARQDNQNNRSMQDAQSGNNNNQQAQSNTTDPKTTSGSAK